MNAFADRLVHRAVARLVGVLSVAYPKIEYAYVVSPEEADWPHIAFWEVSPPKRDVSFAVVEQAAGWAFLDGQSGEVFATDPGLVGCLEAALVAASEILGVVDGRAPKMPLPLSPRASIADRALERLRDLVETHGKLETEAA